jgi:putative addiction module CopG family antidote
MNISLRPDIAKFVDDKVKAGQYASADDVVNVALEALKDQEDFPPEHALYIREEIRKGLQQLNGGQSSQFDANKIISEERARLGAKEKP